MFMEEHQEDSCGVILQPCPDGQYMLQLLPKNFPELINPTPSPGGFREEGEQDYCETVNGDPWFLCKQGQYISISHYAQEGHEDFQFSLQVDESGCVRLCGGLNKGYWTSDPAGRLLVGVQKAGKRETFQLIEYAFSIDAKRLPWMSLAPVRVNFKAHTGRYLCCASAVISAIAEAPCCCEEFLLDVNFPPLPPCWESSTPHNKLSSPEIQLAKQSVESVQSSYSRIRTANGMFNLSAGADGKLTMVQLDEAQGHEHFTIELLDHKRRSKVSMGHHGSQDNPDALYYVSVEPSSKVTCNKLHRRKWEEFVLELANGSRILIQSVHGGFMRSPEISTQVDATSFSGHTRGTRTEDNNSRRVCSCSLVSLEGSMVGAWRLRAHGDSLYTLVAVTTPRDGGDVYLFVDARGKIMQSNEPGIHFPALASLFEIKPVTTACFAGATEHGMKTSTTKAAVVGFTIKTIRKINGKQRYLSVEPNGILRASRLRLSRWEIFRLVDIDATASVVLPSKYLCLPAAVNLFAATTPTAFLSLRQAAASQGVVTAPMSSYGRGWSAEVSKGGNFLARSNHIMEHTAGKPIHSVASLKKASQIAVMAAWTGRCVPTRMPASLQELCINQLCLQASAEVMKLPDKLQGRLSSALVTECLVDSCVGIPDDLCAKVIAHWCSRQHPESSCKSLSSTFTSQREPLSRSNGNDGGGQDPSNVLQQSLLESSGEGLQCHSCNQTGVLKMDPTVNPAHHRYLEVQYHAQNGLTQPTGFLWNLISFAGVSIMSTALLFHLFADRNNKRRTSRSVR